MKTFGMLAGALALAAAVSTGAAAQELRGKKAGDFVIGLGAIGVLPQNVGGSTSLIGGKVEADNAVTPQLDFTYFFTPNVAVNLIAATSRHDLTLKGSALGDVNLGRVWVLPPTLTLQYHPLPNSRISPYVGAGLNWTFFYGYGGDKTAPVNRVRIDSTPAFAMVAGVDYEVAPNWLVNLDAKKILLRPDASVNSGLVNARVNLDPWVVGASVRYRF
ncbi:OmpW/AlkL family protein [Roseicella aerolata]|uniref:Outer membrane beta-barrel protein n=1 Tax=Roseicella aerolata TaxID=2883479 RepID=A0A9X1IHT4_9PROT|nr:OmpW family outer membrane protein [Roseicella aerolata]MCB4825081.1 outer membrane beta-barrel protein [Roseicella aerolata]